MTLNLSLGESAGSRSLHRLVGRCLGSFPFVRLGIWFWLSCEKSLHRLTHPSQSPLAIHLVEGRCVDDQVPPRDELARDQGLVFLLIE